MISIDEKTIVKISPHFAGRFQAGINVKLLPVGKGRKVPGDQLQLDFPGHCQFAFDFLLFSDGDLQGFRLKFDLPSEKDVSQNDQPHDDSDGA